MMMSYYHIWQIRKWHVLFVMKGAASFETAPQPMKVTVARTQPSNRHQHLQPGGAQHDHRARWRVLVANAASQSSLLISHTLQAAIINREPVCEVVPDKSVFAQRNFFLKVHQRVKDSFSLCFVSPTCRHAVCADVDSFSKMHLFFFFFL